MCEMQCWGNVEKENGRQECLSRRERNDCLTQMPYVLNGTDCLKSQIF
jgi:hypothetical protein